MQPQSNNLAQEIILGIIASLLILGGVGLLYVHTIDFTAAVLMFGSALALFGVNGALKAPSPSQQVQLNTQQANLQQLLSQFLSVLPGLVQSFSQPLPAQVLQTAPPVASQPAVASGVLAQSPDVPQQQFKTPPQAAQQLFNPATPAPVLSQDSFPMAAIGRPPQQ